MTILFADDSAVSRSLVQGILATQGHVSVEELWSAAGIEEVRSRRMSLGGGVVVWGTRA